MQSVLLISTDRQTQTNYIEAFCTKNTIYSVDKTVITSEKALGIEDIRAMQKTVFLKPLKSKEKVIVIEHVDTATIQTQNALLKLLEEPPPHTILMLTAGTEQTILPTVLSRCTIILLDKRYEHSPELLEQTKQELQTVRHASLQTKLYLAQNLAAKKEDTITWLTNMMYAARQILLDNSQNLQESNTIIVLLHRLQKTYTLMTTTQVNTRFLLEDLLLHI